LDKTGTHYRLIAITLGLVLLAGTIFGSAPTVFADDDDDRKKRLTELIAKVRGHLENDICAEEKKFIDSFGNKICDNVKPEVDITFPQKRAQLPSQGTTTTVTITGTTSDFGSGVKDVLVRVVGLGGNVPATINNGDWELTLNLSDGRYVAFATVSDNVGNTKRAFTVFTVV